MVHYNTRVRYMGIKGKIEKKKNNNKTSHYIILKELVESTIDITTSHPLQNKNKKESYTFDAFVPCPRRTSYLSPSKQ